MKKTLTVRLPAALVADIESEAKERQIAKSDVVRERLTVPSGGRKTEPDPLAAIADLIGSVDGLPSDLSANVKKYLKKTGYGRPKRPR